MSERYKIKNQHSPYFITFTITDWIDVFTRPEYKHAIIDSLKYCQKKKGLIIHAYVIMSNHLHAIVSTSEQFELQAIIKDFKKYTSKQIINLIKELPESRREWMLFRFKSAARRIKRGVNYKVWQDGFHPIELDTNEMLDQRLNYIHRNPVKAEIVIDDENYRYSSAIDYADGVGEIKINKIS